MNGQPTRVFISYSHDSPPHMDRVLELSDRLRAEGIDCQIDQYEQAPPEGWPLWCQRQVEESKFVLVVCTETYKRRFDGKEVPGKGKGVSFEGYVINQMIYDYQSKNTRFIPITFSAEDLEFIPVILRGSSFYNVSRVREYEELYRRLTNQPSVIMKPVGKVKELPPGKSKIAVAVAPPPLGMVRAVSAIGTGRPPQSLAVSAQQQSVRSASPALPVIHAAFELSGGEPVIKGKAYKIWVSVKNVPEGTEKVNYEILDDTFPDPKFSVPWGKTDFADWITSYGDIFLTAKGRGKNGSWRTQTTLAEALWASYGANPKTIIRRAIADIENN